MKITIHPVAMDVNRAALVAAQLAEARIHEHRAGLHPWGAMRRDCPLCQQGRAS